MDFPGGKVPITPQMKFISESSEKRLPCYRVLDDDGYPIPGTIFEEVICNSFRFELEKWIEI